MNQCCMDLFCYLFIFIDIYLFYFLELCVMMYWLVGNRPDSIISFLAAPCQVRAVWAPGRQFFLFRECMAYLRVWFLMIHVCRSQNADALVDAKKNTNEYPRHMAACMGNVRGARLRVPCRQQGCGSMKLCINCQF
jgi:hypothetical protein